MLVLPGLIAAARAARSLVARVATGAVLALGCTWGVLSYAHHLATTARTSYVGTRHFATLTMNAATGAALQEVARSVPSDVAVLTDSAEFALELPGRRVALLPGDFATHRWQGRPQSRLLLLEKPPEPAKLPVIFPTAPGSGWQYQPTASMQFLFLGPTPPGNLPWRPW